MFSRCRDNLSLSMAGKEEKLHLSSEKKSGFYELGFRILLETAVLEG